MGHREALVDGQAFELVEDRGMGGVKLIGAERLARRGDIERGPAFQQRPSLHGRSMGPEHETAIGWLDEEGVLHLSGWVIGIEVERVEVEPLRLDLRPVDDLPAHADHDVGHPLGHQRQWMPPAQRAGPRRGRQVDGFLDQDALVTLHLQLCGPGRHGLVDPPTRLAHELASLRLVSSG